MNVQGPIVAAIVLAWAVAGCVATVPPHAGCQEAGLVTAAFWHGPVVSDDRFETDGLMRLHGNASTAWRLNANMTAALGAALAVEATVWGNGSTRLARLRLPGDAASSTYRVSGSVSQVAGPGDCAVRPTEFGEAGPVTVGHGDILVAGKGAHVWYAGFWENGTMFETNIDSFDRSPWPRAGWYESGSYAPLPVYVYEDSPSEQPAHWKPLARAVATGTPVDGPAKQGGALADATAGTGYFTTIKGFNDGLKGLSTMSTRVIWMPVADAYPAGTPDNPVAGKNLVFYVHLADVVDAPCPTNLAPSLGCQIP